MIFDLNMWIRCSYISMFDAKDKGFSNGSGIGIGSVTPTVYTITTMVCKYTINLPVTKNTQNALCADCRHARTLLLYMLFMDFKCNALCVYLSVRSVSLWCLICLYSWRVRVMYLCTFWIMTKNYVLRDHRYRLSLAPHHSPCCCVVW